MKCLIDYVRYSIDIIHTLYGINKKCCIEKWEQGPRDCYSNRQNANKKEVNRGQLSFCYLKEAEIYQYDIHTNETG